MLFQKRHYSIIEKGEEDQEKIKNKMDFLIVNKPGY